MRILQINSSVNRGSTGRIAEDIGRLLIAGGDESYIAYGRSNNGSESKTVRVGGRKDLILHGLKSRILDLHGFGSKKATKEFIAYAEKIEPDLIHLHNIHGYYINAEALFRFLDIYGKPVIWTFHDCWPFTGHCSYFDAVGCNRWQDRCFDCPNKNAYPGSWFRDNSTGNYMRKKVLFNLPGDMTIVTPSEWLRSHVKRSFLKKHRIEHIPNGIDLDTFRPANSHELLEKKYGVKKGKIVLGVANKWDHRKGLSDFIRLRELLPDDIQIVLVGLSKSQIASLPGGISGLERTDSTHELALLYSCSSVYLNPTYVDNFPTTNLEALACGTPVIAYDTGGCPESIKPETGVVISKGNVKMLSESVLELINSGKEQYSSQCRLHAEKYFNKTDRYNDYLELYRSLANIQ